MKRLTIFTLAAMVFAYFTLGSQSFAVELKSTNTGRQMPVRTYQNTSVVPNAVSIRLARMDAVIVTMGKQISILKAEVSKLKNHSHTFKREDLGWVSVKTVIATKMGLLHVKYPGASSSPVTVNTSKPVY